MGYHTYYKIHAVDATTHEPRTKEFLDQFSFYDNSSCLTSTGDGRCYVFGGEPMSHWATYEQELRQISMNEKTTIFILDGEGEVQGDVWRKFFYKGKMVSWEQEVTIPPSVEEIKWT